MNNEKKEKIVRALKDKGVNLPCPRCGDLNFEVVGQTVFSLNDSPCDIVLGGPAVPAALVVCSNCGFVTFHALGPLNLMPEAEKRT